MGGREWKREREGGKKGMEEVRKNGHIVSHSTVSYNIERTDSRTGPSRLQDTNVLRSRLLARVLCDGYLMITSVRR